MLNELNLELQGKEKMVVNMISSVNAFKRKLQLLTSKLQHHKLGNFQNITSEQKHGKEPAQLDRSFQDFALLEPVATFMCFPFGDEHEVDSLASDMGELFQMNPSALGDEILALQTDIQVKVRPVDSFGTFLQKTSIQISENVPPH